MLTRSQNGVGRGSEEFERTVVNKEEDDMNRERQIKKEGGRGNRKQ